MMVTDLEDYAIAFASGVAKHAEVTLFAPLRQFGALRQFFDPRVRLRLLDWPRHRSPASLGLVRRLVRLVREERPDIVHLLSNNTLWLNAAVPFWRPLPILTTVHDVHVHPGDRETRRLPSWSTAAIVRQSDDVLVHGAGLRRQALERFGKPGDRVHVASHPAILRYANLARREGLAPSARSGFNVLLFGRIFAYKGLDVLLRAASLLPDRVPGLRITIAGRGDDPKALRPLMDGRVRFDIRHRYVENREVAQLFLDADLVALPYMEASQSGVLHLAGSFGKAVVGTHVGELGYTVRQHGLGLVVPPGDPEALAAAILRLATHPAELSALGAAALAWAEGDNAPEAVGRSVAELYRAIRRRGRG